MTDNPSNSPQPDRIPPDDPTRNLTPARPDEDQSLPHIGMVGDTYTILLTGEDTTGRYTLIDMHVPQGGGPAPHRHDFEEMFTVLEGEIEATFRGEKSTVRAGETINIPGISQAKNAPSATALTTTSTTDRPLIAVKSRRNSIAGIDTAAEYSKGGNTPARIHSGSILTAGTNDKKLAPMPITTSTSGAASPRRGSSVVAAAITSNARTIRIRNSTVSSPLPV